ncbi:MAG: winged helix-turn-helix transcriptional regulator [Thermoguttaceae bacterium]|nr:winged helix-turn-helix transcriptional regulator [Thermoguttaceae bacterium]
MLSDWKVGQVEVLLRKGLVSQREIARRCGVSRGTVRTISLGMRRQRPPSNEGFVPPEENPQRCPGCGGLVKMPCLYCQLRQMSREHMRARTAAKQ